MKLFNTVVFTLVGLSILSTSCNKTKTFEDYKREERNAISRYISQNDLNILNSFPSDTVFGAKDFYKDPATGVYFNIIERGDPTQKPQWREKIYIRFKGLSYIKGSDTTRYSNLHNIDPAVMDYFGPVSSNTQNIYSTPGWAVPLTYVGHKGKVKLIVPFEMGASYDQSSYEPTYYDQVEYRFEGQY